MNDEPVNYVQSKKKNAIDDNGPVSKKVLKAQKKNLNRTLQANARKEEFISNQESKKVEEVKVKKGPDRR